MKRIVLILAVTAGLGFSACAQNKRLADKTPQQRAEMMTKRLTKQLDLSEQQTDKVNAIFLAQAVRMDSLRSNHKAHVKKDSVHARGNKKHHRFANRGMFKETDEKLNAVLNAEQKKAYAELKAEQRKKIEARRAEKKQG